MTEFQISTNFMKTCSEPTLVEGIDPNEGVNLEIMDKMDDSRFETQMLLQLDEKNLDKCCSKDFSCKKRLEKTEIRDCCATKKCSEVFPSKKLSSCTLESLLWRHVANFYWSKADAAKYCFFREYNMKLVLCTQDSKGCRMGEK
jgi:hypothetical protein